MSAPAGWYADTQVPGGQRYWDGTMWTSHRTAPAISPTTPAISLSTPAGWYPDTQVPGGQRYWNGTQWTAHRTQAVRAYPTVPGQWNGAGYAATYPGAAAPSRGPGVWVAVAGVTMVVVLLGLAATAGLSTFGDPGYSSDYSSADVEDTVADLEAAEARRAQSGVDTALDTDGDGEVSLDESEAFAATFDGYAASDGTYVEAASELVRAFGMTLAWADVADPNSGSACTGPDGWRVEPADVGGFYCEDEPTLIYLNTSNEYFLESMRDISLIDLVKHEVAHHVIDKRCGTPDPWIATKLDVDYESVTDAYTVVYMGVSAEDLEVFADPDYPQYDLTPASYEAAELIHDGQCR